MWKVLRMLSAEPACVWLCLYSFPSWILFLLVEQKRYWFTASTVYPLFSPQDFGGICVCVLPFGSWRQDGATGDLLQGMARRAACGFAEWDAGLCWCPVKPVFVSALLFKSTCLFHSGEKKKSARKCWQIFPACWSCGFITINRTLNWLFENSYKNWLDAYEEINMGQSVAAQWYEFDDLLGHFCV